MPLPEHAITLAQRKMQDEVQLIVETTTKVLKGTGCIMIVALPNSEVYVGIRTSDRMPPVPLARLLQLVVDDINAAPANYEGEGRHVRPYVI